MYNGTTTTSGAAAQQRDNEAIIAIKLPGYHCVASDRSSRISSEEFSKKFTRVIDTIRSAATIRRRIFSHRYIIKSI